MKVWKLRHLLLCGTFFSSGDERTKISFFRFYFFASSKCKYKFCLRFVGARWTKEENRELWSGQTRWKSQNVWLFVGHRCVWWFAGFYNIKYWLDTDDLGAIYSFERWLIFEQTIAAFGRVFSANIKNVHAHRKQREKRRFFAFHNMFL